MKSLKKPEMSTKRTKRTKWQHVKNKPEALYTPKRFHLARPGGSLQV